MRKFVTLAVTLSALALIALSSTAVAQQRLNVTVGPGRDEASATGTAMLEDIGGRTRVTVQVAATNPNMIGHVHADECPGVGGVVFPLQNTVNGRSVTEIDAPLSEVLARGKSINLHKSPSEAGIYTGCANLPAPGAAAPAATGGPSALVLAGGIAAAGASLMGGGLYLRRRRS